MGTKMVEKSPGMYWNLLTLSAQGAIRHYGADPGKVKVVPFGANISDKPVVKEIESLIGSRSREIFHLLFLGVDWERKGGQKALEIAKALQESGVRVRLHVVGIRSLPIQEKPDFLIDYGFIGKDTVEGRKKILRLLTQSHFLLLPTKADCSPIVLCEANAFGLPAITTMVGGIPTMIREGINGHLFECDAPPVKVADKIAQAWVDEDGYKDLCRSSYNEYATRLNWDNASKSLRELLEELA